MLLCKTRHDDAHVIGANLLLVGVVGPDGPCDQVSINRLANSRSYLVSYCPSVCGQHDVVIKWDDQHIKGSPFHVNVLPPH